MYFATDSAECRKFLEFCVVAVERKNVHIEVARKVFDDIEDTKFVPTDSRKRESRRYDQNTRPGRCVHGEANIPLSRQLLTKFATLPRVLPFPATTVAYALVIPSIRDKSGWCFVG